MGRVTEIRTSGDNDTPIRPVRYEMHYLYCDQCGSFDLQTWVEPENHEMLENRVKQFGQIAAGLGGLIALYTIFVFLDAIPVVFIGTIVVIVLLIIRARIKSKIKERGVSCKACNSKYEFGSSFFSSEENPKNFTMEEVPLPLNSNYQMVGSILGPENEA